MNLADRIEAHLEDIAPLTAEEIASDLRVRPVAVRQALRNDDLRFVAVRLPNRSRSAVGWMLKPLPQRAADGRGRPALLDESESRIDSGEKTGANGDEPCEAHRFSDSSSSAFIGEGIA